MKKKRNKMEKKRNYLLGVKGKSLEYPRIKYYGTLRGAKAACTRHYGPAIHRGEHLMVRYDEHGENWETVKYDDGWRE